MTPAARYAAAIEVLEAHLAGQPAEKALTNWARAHRFAGSKDRAAIRDHVFDVLRRKRSCAARGGAMTGRGLILGLLRGDGIAPETVFTGEGHAPAPLSREEAVLPPADLSEAVALDCPDWLVDPLKSSLGNDFAPVLEALQQRAPVFLRVNLARLSRDDAAKALAEEDIATRPHPLSPSALEVTGNARRVQQSAAYLEGRVEVQDAASQAVVDLLPLEPGQRVLDLCAGGGGKTLAMAARADLTLCAYDAAPQRMRDLPARAARAGVQVTLLTGADPEARAPFDLVLCDVPCSGSGAWRRSPEGKWTLSPERLETLLHLQRQILDRAAPLVAPGGVLAYATCSMLEAENGAQVAAFLARGGWSCEAERRLTPLDGGDGFFGAILRRG